MAASLVLAGGLESGRVLVVWGMMVSLAEIPTEVGIESEVTIYYSWVGLLEEGG